MRQQAKFNFLSAVRATRTASGFAFYRRFVEARARSVLTERQKTLSLNTKP